MSKKRISLRNEHGNTIDYVWVDDFSLDKIPNDWNVEHNYSIWFEDEKEWGLEE